MLTLPVSRFGRPSLVIGALVVSLLACGASPPADEPVAASASAVTSDDTGMKAEVCHAGQTISVARPAISAHLRHGDSLGGCPSPCVADGCDDGDVCSANFCDPFTGGCASTPVSCDDSNPCTADSCDPATGCRATPVPDGSRCEDGPCTGPACPDHVCQGGACISASVARCDAVDHERLTASIPSYFMANAPASLCVPPTTVGSDALAGTVTICTRSTCNGAPGCAVDLHWYSAVASTGQVDVLASPAGNLDVTVANSPLFGTATCSLAARFPGSEYAAFFTSPEVAGHLEVLLGSERFDVGPVELSGCSGLGPIAEIVVHLARESVGSILQQSLPRDSAHLEDFVWECSPPPADSVLVCEPIPSARSR